MSFTVYHHRSLRSLALCFRISRRCLVLYRDCISYIPLHLLYISMHLGLLHCLLLQCYLCCNTYRYCLVSAYVSLTMLQRHYIAYISLYLSLLPLYTPPGHYSAISAMPSAARRVPTWACQPSSRERRSRCRHASSRPTPRQYVTAQPKSGRVALYTSSVSLLSLTLHSARSCSFYSYLCCLGLFFSSMSLWLARTTRSSVIVLLSFCFA